MKKTITALLMTIIATSAFAEFYKVDVRRVDKDVYRTSDGFVIITKYCYEYARGDEAILKYDRYSYDNKLIFEDGTSCEVAKVVK